MIAGLHNLVGFLYVTLFFMGCYFRGIGPHKIESWILQLPLFIQVFIALILLQLSMERFSLELFSLPLLWVLQSLFWFTSFMLHEAGHIYWSVFGEILGTLGGTLNETLIPLGFFIYCLIRGYFQLGGICLFLLGYYLHGVSWYMADASKRADALIQGHGVHDWKYLFDTFGIAQYGNPISDATWAIGVLLAFLGVLLFLVGMGLQFKLRHSNC